jgi:hypothetical protein
MRNRSWILVFSGLCFVALYSCARSHGPIHPDKQLMTFADGGRKGGFFLYRRGPMGSDYITIEVDAGSQRATLASIATCAFVAARLTARVLDIEFYNSDYFISDSRGQLSNFAATVPEMVIHSTVNIPSEEKLIELRNNGFTVLDCQSVAGLDRTLPGN